MITKVMRYQTENNREFDTEDEALREETRYRLGSILHNEMMKHGNTADIIAGIVIRRFPEISELVNRWQDADAAIKLRFKND